MPAVSSSSTSRTKPARRRPSSTPSRSSSSQSRRPRGNAPSFQQAAGGSYIRSGQAGESVRQLQERLRAEGHDIEADGKFGPETRRAVREYQRANGLQVDGVVGPETLGSMGYVSSTSAMESRRRGDERRARGDAIGNPRAPSAPRDDTLNVRTAPATTEQPRRGLSNGGLDGVDSVQGPLQDGSPADQRLAELQRRSMDSARRELDAGVRERGSSNRGDRVDQYARESGMREGGEWCGYFTSHNYRQAAQETGTEFTGARRMHSWQKARSYFNYRSYTNNSRSYNEGQDAMRAEHVAQGSSRRYMTFAGSDSDRYATRQGWSHETYQGPRDLPIREGDTVLWAYEGSRNRRGHVGMVESYNRETGILTTVEGNTNGGRVARNTYDLNDPVVRDRIEGFGRPAAGDFVQASPD